MGCLKYTLVNTGSTIVTFNYRRCDDSVWQNQVELLPGQIKNIWLIEDTFSIPSLFDQQMDYETIENFPPELTPTPSSTPVITPTPSSTPVITPTPSSTPGITSTPSATPDPTPTPSSTPIPPPNDLNYTIIPNDDITYIFL